MKFSKSIMRYIILIFSVFLFSISCELVYSQNSFSTAGFYSVPNSGREVYDFNVGWKFHLGDIEDAEKADFNDDEWKVVSTPHTVQLVPQAASGGKNYQGIVWYRKHFHTPKEFTGKKIGLHFEAIMGKSAIYVNGKKATVHFGGFLPVILDLSAVGVNADEDCVISVCADNSDDSTYPPGKPQSVLDFCYFGGIYRDCWLYSTDYVHITDANYSNKIAGGGVFVTTQKATTAEAELKIKTHVVNETNNKKRLVVTNKLINSSGVQVAEISSAVTLNGGENKEVIQVLKINKPQLWHPNHPTLNTVQTEITSSKKTIDALQTKIGIRTVEFIPEKGLSINGEILKEKLVGVNRHQDFGYIGMALTNNLHYADVKKLRDAGVNIIRSAHYPQDPAFMDACDQLGIFVIVATPGWQFWNDNGEFENRVLTDIRNMVRRDRNHPSVLLWEPILNETRYPVSFAENAYNAVHEEYPEKGCYAACDDISLGSERFDVIYSAPKSEDFYKKLGKCCFTREFGDCVDDWYSHNSYSRVSRDWSEQGLIFQAQHYAKKNYEGSLTLDQIFKSPPAHVGGTLWHSFDHQRGYHPDPFYGGIMDEFRQPKYSYYMFQSQRNPLKEIENVDSGPVLFIANAMTPISPVDVTVYTNCDSVNLMVMKFKDMNGKRVFYPDTICKKVIHNKSGIPYEPLTFENAFDFVTVRAMHRANQSEGVKMIAEGFIDGKKVIRKETMPSKRSDKIQLRLDSAAWANVSANGSDIIEIIASVEDERGYVKQLANEQIEFSVSGEGTIMGDAGIGANPVRVIKGTAPLLLRTTPQAGKITVIARTYFEGITTPKPDTLTFFTKSSDIKLLYKDIPATKTNPSILNKTNRSEKAIARSKKEQSEVERDQLYFESTEKPKK